MLRAFSWVVLSNLARQVSFLIVNAVLFERLSRSVFGSLALAFSYMVVFAGLGEFGIRQIGWRDVARWPDRVRDLAGPYLGAKLTASAVSITLYVAMLPVLWTVDAPPAIYLTYALGIALSGGTFDFPLFGLSRIDLFAKFSLVAFTAYAVGCLSLVTDDSRALLVPILFGISMALLFGLEFWWFWSAHGSINPWPKRKELLRILRESWPLGLGETANRVSINYPLIMVGFLVGSAGAGNYRIAELGYAFLAQFGHMFAAAGFSQLSSLFQHRRSQFTPALVRMSSIVSVAALLVGLLFAALGPAVLELVFGEVDPQTSQVVRILGVALIFSGPARLLKALLTSIDRQAMLLPVTALTTLIGIGLGWFLSSEHGIAGIAGGVLTAEVVALVLLLVIFKRAVRQASHDAP